jgi:hypothetical protein
MKSSNPLYGSWLRSVFLNYAIEYGFEGFLCVLSQIAGFSMAERESDMYKYFSKSKFRREIYA